ncbi:pilus assembly protein TadG-related protein [Methylobacterium sp. J-068]|uniref:pilus assembly protein TadG-related protein n=1 Tax=Methylobacterium sp. J-068 TaxID=2836649 RepID=UPI001FB928D4|nr:pilus assembly protein TadG-related protein [Methylobacterium sp. J-068]MCJ2035382.1 pilus assembly protein TadG-related protein [Methylobacterium sp. J-068]
MTAQPALRLARIRRRLRTLRDARGGNVLIVFALALIPLIGLVGVGVDYVRGINYRAHFDRAADAATITAIATARDYISANPNNESNPTASALTLGQTRGLSAFRVNAGAILNSLPLTPSLTVTRTGNVVTATATYASTFSSPFSRVFSDVTAIAVSGKSSSSLTLGSYSDFYLLLDTSGSMGFPTSSAAQVAFAKMNPDMADWLGNNCAFACHFSGYKGFDLAKANKIELRIATVSNAVQSLISKAQSNQTLINQYRIGLYPFVSYLETAADITTNLSSLTSVNLENYMDIGDSTVPRGSGGTHYENVFATIASKIKYVGDGSSASSPLPFIFLVTDGVGNNQYWYNKTGWTGSQAKLLDPTLCKALKDKGVTVSVLYIPYVPLATPFNSNVGYENIVVNNLIPSVPTTLQTCASSGYFRTASSATEIQEALNSMFDQATRKARLVAGP